MAVLWAQQVRAEPTRTNCADLGTKVHSVARFKELIDMIMLVDLNNFVAEASTETLPVAGVTRSPSSLASLVTFLFALVVQGEAKDLAEAEAWVAFFAQGQFFLRVGRIFQVMLFISGVGFLLGIIVGIICILAWRRDLRATWLSWLWKRAGGVLLNTWDESLGDRQ